jgi:hypothetical protein
MVAFGFSVATTPDGIICDGCLDSPAAQGLPIRRLVVSANAKPNCEFCGDKAQPDFGTLDDADLNY